RAAKGSGPRWNRGCWPLARSRPLARRAATSCRRTNTRSAGIIQRGISGPSCPDASSVLLDDGCSATPPSRGASSSSDGSSTRPPCRQAFSNERREPQGLMLEFVAVACGLANIYLTVRQNIWCWPVGAVMVSLYIYIFFGARLYSDAL